MYCKIFDAKEFKMSILAMLREKFPSITGVIIEYMKPVEEKLAEAQDRISALFDKEIIEVK